MNTPTVSGIKCALLIALLGAGASHGIIVAGSNGADGNNQTEESLLNQHADFNLWDNVVSVGNGTGVYLGQSGSQNTGYILTAKHVMIPNAGLVSVAGTSYSITDNRTIGTADLRLYEIGGGVMPNLPSVTFATEDPAYNESLIMLGHGVRVQGTDYDPNTSDLANVSGTQAYDWAGKGALGWGENNAAPFFGSGDPVISYTNSLGNREEDFFATFDDPGKGNYTTSWEGMASGGDSGGPVFAYRDGEYELAGIISTVYANRGQSDRSSAAFGNKTAMVNVAEYASALPELEDAVATPEPGSALLALLGLMQCVLVRRRDRS